MAIRRSKRSRNDTGVKHQSHKEIITRLNRVSGHLSTVARMVEAGDPCINILQQLSAVISALGGLRLTILQDHLDSCLRPALTSGKKDLVDDLKILLKRGIRT